MTIRYGPTPSLREVVDEIAAARASWVLVERHGETLAHAPGPGPCPAALADAIVRRSTQALSSGWRSLDLRAADTGDGLRVWTTGAAPTVDELRRIRCACAESEPPVTDAVVADLLHDRGSAARVAARTRLVALQLGPTVVAVSRQAARLLGRRGSVHSEDDWIYLALLPSEPVAPIVAALSRPGWVLHAGVVDVPQGARSWSAPARLARRLAAVACALGDAVATAQDPTALTTLVLDEARAATSVLLRDLDVAPLERLRDYDARSGGVLLPSLSTWLAEGCDTGRAAHALMTHPNTVRYRLRRVREISGFDLDDADVQAALRLLLEPAGAEQVARALLLPAAAGA